MGRKTIKNNNEKCRCVGDEEAAVLCHVATNEENSITEGIGSTTSSTTMVPPQKLKQEIYCGLHSK